MRSDRSKLTPSPTRRTPKFVFRNDSSITTVVKEDASRATTVWHTPLIATLSSTSSSEDSGVA